LKPFNNIDEPVRSRCAALVAYFLCIGVCTKRQHATRSVPNSDKKNIE